MSSHDSSSDDENYYTSFAAGDNASSNNDSFIGGLRDDSPLKDNNLHLLTKSGKWRRLAKERAAPDFSPPPSKVPRTSTPTGEPFLSDDESTSMILDSSHQRTASNEQGSLSDSIVLGEFRPGSRSMLSPQPFLDDFNLEDASLFFEPRRRPLYDSSDDEEYEDAVDFLFSDEIDQQSNNFPASFNVSTTSDENETTHLNEISTENEATVGDTSFHNISVERNEEAANSPVAKIAGFLRSWAVQHNIPQVALSSLSKGLKEVHNECFSGLPIDARTILKTPKDPYSPIPIAPGKYIHIGLLTMLLFLASLLPDTVDCIPILFNVDGVPLFDHTTDQLWPILLMIPTLLGFKGKVLPIGLYYGPGKPSDWNAFFNQLIDEIVTIFQNGGFEYNGRKIRIELLGFTCDAPARAYILGTISHQGFYSCFRCVTKGKSVGRRRIFPNTKARSRTDEKFRRRAYVHFQPRDTPLLHLPGLHFTQSFVLDYLHLCLLGVTRYFVNLWFKGGVPIMLKPDERQNLSLELNRVTPFVPSDFSRKPKEMEKGAHWKGTEARLFLLYEAPVVLKGHLTDEKYQHFLLFSAAMTILLKPSLCANVALRRMARLFLIEFVEGIKSLYGTSFITHNCHHLIHLVDDADFFVDSIPNFTLDDISCFPAENFMQLFKRLTRARYKPLEQLGKRFWELFTSEYWKKKFVHQINDEKHFTEENSVGPLPASCHGRQYRGVKFGKFKFRLNAKDNVCGTSNGDIIEIRNFVVTEDNEELIVGQKYSHTASFYSTPLCSTSFGVYKVSDLSEPLETWPLSSISTKYVRLPHDDYFVVLPILHADQQRYL